MEMMAWVHLTLLSVMLWSEVSEQCQSRLKACLHMLAACRARGVAGFGTEEMFRPAMDGRSGLVIFTHIYKCLMFHQMFNCLASLWAH
jgi:hypothetical protein